MTDDDDKPLDPRELIVSKETREYRLSICNNCERYTKIKFCSVCKCFMPAKTWLQVSSCPINKWE